MPTGREHAPGLEELQIIVYPTLHDNQRFKVDHYLKHIALFPEGQFVALDDGNVVGMTSSLRCNFDFERPLHTFAEISSGGWLTTHETEGGWLYGVDTGVHPRYRRRGIGRALYAARQRTVRELDLEGQVAVGTPRGYRPLKAELTAESYYEAVVKGERVDPTITAQMAIGFEPRGLIPGYLRDPVCDGYGFLLVLPRDKEVSSPAGG